MKIILLLSFVFLLNISMYPEDDLDITIILSQRAFAGGLLETHKTTLKKALVLPDWDPADKNECPLKISDAIEKCKKWLSLKHPKMDSFIPTKINLSSISHYKVNNKWYYHIIFEPVLGKERMFGSQLNVVILTDGEIIEPISTK